MEGTETLAFKNMANYVTLILNNRNKTFKI